MEPKLWVLRQCLCAVWHFMCLHSHTYTAVDAGNICTSRITVILITRKTQRPQFEPHAGIKMAQVLGSPLYICGAVTKICEQTGLAYSANLLAQSACSKNGSSTISRGTITHLHSVIANWYDLSQTTLI